MPIKDYLLEQGPRLAMMAMAAKQAGPQGLAAFMEGLQRKQMLEQQLARQGEQDARAAELHQAQLGNYERDNARADESLQQQKFARALQLIQAAQAQQGELATDPMQADAALQEQAGAAANAFGVPPEQLTPFVQPMAPIISARKKKQAQVLYERAEKRFNPKGENPEWESSITLQTGDQFGDVTPAALRAMFEAPAVDATGAPALPPGPVEKPPTPGSFEEYVDAPPERQAAIEAARKRYMQADDRPLASQQPSPSGLPPRVQARANRLADMFRQDPAIKRTTVIAEGYAFAKGLNDNSKNPADDQALIYAFAKAMDPDSVVREGEYNTVQKYAQSWMQSFGFNAQRILTNSEFLTPEARRNLKATIAQKYQAARRQYDNIRQQSAAQINKATGLLDGDEYLMDYSAAFPDDAPAAAPVTSGVPTYQDYLRSRGAQ